tara:strand:+ start:1772 stop:2038 length:267 start_codon:yes stop_codon:yes gene_type:complete
MPKYHYRCSSCTREWWEWRTMSQSDLEVCPHCEVSGVVKVPVSFSVIKDTVQEKKGAKRNVIDHIEENREILKNMRDQAKDKDVLTDD